MINIKTVICAVVSTILGCIFGIGMLYETAAPEWAVNSLITITSLQIFIHISQTLPGEDIKNAR